MQTPLKKKNIILLTAVLKYLLTEHLTESAVFHLSVYHLHLLCAVVLFTPIFSLLTCLHGIPPHSLNACSSVTLSTPPHKTQRARETPLVEKGEKWSHFPVRFVKATSKNFPRGCQSTFIG